MKILCVFGQYQYGTKSRGVSTEYFSFLPAFQNLGHEVIFFDSWDRTLYNDFIELNTALIETVKKRTPDIIFSVQLGYEIWLETWEHIRTNFHCKTINWCTDDSWKYKEHSKFIANHFDLMVTTYEEFLPLYAQQGANAILSGWGCPVQWLKEPKKAQDCKYKVTFVGAAHGDRKEKIKKLKEYGADVQCFGYGWENGAINANEIPNIFNDSIISLNFANSSGENQIKARIFEVTGSGGFLLTEDAKNLDKAFTNTEVAIFEDIQSCAEKINYYLNNLEKRDDIVTNSFNKTSNNYTYINRVKDILTNSSESKYKIISDVNFEHAVQQHKKGFILSLLRKVLLLLGKIIFTKEKGKRFARRAAYELSWRFFGSATYKAKGIVGRMFYEE